MPGSNSPKRRRTELAQSIAKTKLALAPQLRGHQVNLTVRRVDFQAIVDSLNRASLAVRQAQRLAGAANRAFADEAANLDSIKSTLESILASTDIV